MANYPLLTFNAGELSPQIDSRSDVDKYRAGCRILENMIPRIYGPATRRPGTKYIDTCNGVSRVIPFTYSNTISYILLLEDRKMYFYYNGGQVLDTWGRRLYIDTPYLAADLFELQYKQSNDVMWIVHPDYQQRKLTRTTANSFSLDTITFNKGPFKKRNDLANDDGVTMTPSVTTGTGTLTASSATFDVGHFGALFAVTQPRVNTSISGTLQATGILGGTSILTEGPCTLNISDGWSGTIELQRSIDDGVTWETRRSFYSNDGKRAIQYTFDEQEDDVLHRVNVTSYNATYTQQISITDEDGYVGEQTVSKTSEISGDLTVDSSTQTGRCRITGYVSPTVVNMEVVKTFASTDAETRWYEGCWSTYRGYPGSVTFFNERCVFAATTHQPQTTWLSAVDDFENFDETKSTDDAAFSLTLSSDTRNGIQWITGVESLLLGTTGGEWRIWSEDDKFSKTNFKLKEQTQRGSKQLQALPCGDAVLFADYVGRKIRELTYDGGVKYKYISPDLTSLAEHITESGIVGMAFQRNPDPILWSFRDDGTLLSMTYEREQNVIGWARHPFIVGQDVTSEGSLTVPGTVTTPQYRYPTLQELTASEIPPAPAEPTATAGATAVSNATELQNMSGANTYYLTSDIDLTGVSWTPITGFTGVLDGKGYTISNLTISAAASDRQALFGTVGDGVEIYDINLDNFTITGDDYVAALIAEHNAEGSILLKDITITNPTLAGSDYVAPVIGAAFEILDGDIYNVDVTGADITVSNSSSGGLIGDIDLDSTKATDKLYITDCTTAGTMTFVSPDGGDYCGGFAGIISGTNTYDISLHSCSADIAMSWTNGDKAQWIGGFVGSAANTDQISCSATGDIEIDSTSPPSSVTGIGGYVGLEDSTSTRYINCYATGNITIDTTNVNTFSLIGGFGGKFDTNAAITRCYATGDIDITGMSSSISWYGIGGFIGGYLSSHTGSDTTLQRSWSEGDVTLSHEGAPNTGKKGGLGAFIGEMHHSGSNPSSLELTIQNCYAWGSVLITTNPQTYDTAISGFIGTIDYTGGNTITYILTNCYDAQTDTAAGSGYSAQIETGDYSKGVIGWIEGTTTTITETAIFWDTQTSGMTEGNSVGHLTQWMQTKQNYVDNGWNFDTIWYGLDDIVTTIQTTVTAKSLGLGVNSVATIPSSDEDEVWLVVARYINGSVVRYLEQMQPRDWTLNNGDDTDQWFLDSALDYDSTATASFSGLDHLEGETVYALADGEVVTGLTVSNGSVTLPYARSRVIIGLPFRYKLKPMRIDLGGPGHTSQTSVKNIAEMWVSFYKSGNVEWGTDTSNLFKAAWRTTEDYDSPPDLYTGTKQLSLEGGFDPEDPILITGDSPLNCCVRAIIPRVNITGR